MLVIRVEINGLSKSLRALIDSGASHNFLRATTLSVNPDLVCNVVRSGEKLGLRLADGQTLKIDNEVIDLPVPYKDQAFDEQFLLFNRDLKYDKIFGINWSSEYDPKINWKAKTVQFKTAPHDINALVGNDSYIDIVPASHEPLSKDATLSVGIPDDKSFRIQAPGSEVEPDKVQESSEREHPFQEDRLDPSSSCGIATHGRDRNPSLDSDIVHEAEGELEIPVPNQVNGCGNSNDNESVDAASWPEAELSTVAVDLLQLEELEHDEFLEDLRQDQIDEIRVISYSIPDVESRDNVWVVENDYEVAHKELPASKNK